MNPLVRVTGFPNGVVLLCALIVVACTGCQIILPSARDTAGAGCGEPRGAEVHLGPSPAWASHLAGMPDFVPLDASTETGDGRRHPPHPKFHPLPTRPVFAPALDVAPIPVSFAEPTPDTSAVERVRNGVLPEPRDLSPVPELEADEFEGDDVEVHSWTAPPTRTVSSRNRVKRKPSAVNARSKWAEVRVVD